VKRKIKNNTNSLTKKLDAKITKNLSIKKNHNNLNLLRKVLKIYNFKKLIHLKVLNIFIIKNFYNELTKNLKQKDKKI